jgi:hypothetical protein
MNMDWGPHYWGFLHAAAKAYPVTPNAVVKKQYYELIANFTTFIPDEKMATSFGKLLDQYPVTPYLDNRESLVRWTWFIHNKVNQQLEKPTVPLSDLYKIHVPIYKRREKIAFATIVAALLAIVYYNRDSIQ